MNKLKYLVVLLVAFLVIPFAVYAEDEESTNNDAETAEQSDTNKKVQVYFFRGEGCGYCAKAETFFESIQDEYGDLFEIKDYEVWYDTDNADLMQRVAEARDETAEGVPYIIIGDQSWNGFDESYQDSMTSKIKEVYAQDVDDRYDIMKYLDTGDSGSAKTEEGSGARDALILLVIVILCGGVGFGIYTARKSTN